MYVLFFAYFFVHMIFSQTHSYLLCYFSLFIKSVATLLVLVTVICCFGCKQQGQDKIGETTVSGDISSDAQQGALVIAENGESNYVIVWRGRARRGEECRYRSVRMDRGLDGRSTWYEDRHSHSYRARIFADE